MAAKGLSSSRWASARSSSVPATRTSSYPPPPPDSLHPVAVDTPIKSPPPPLSPLPALNSGIQVPNPKTSSVISLTVSQKEAPRAESELSRYLRIVRRMKWKLPFLAQGYQQATDATSAEFADADMMFKLDFFEYYMLLERALVHLQAVFSIVITGKHNESSSSSSNGTGPYKHRYHANVLEALDSTDNPLHGALGKGDVRRALGRAKDLRNRWKNADDANRDPATNLPLESYDLENILTTIYGGLDQACIVATNYVNELKAIAAAAARASAAAYPKFSWADEMETPTPGREDRPPPFEEWPAQEKSKTDEEAEWQFMFDAMDWQAI